MITQDDIDDMSERDHIARAACSLDETLALDPIDAAIDIIRGATLEAAAHGDGRWSGHDFSAAQGEYDPSPVDNAIAVILNAVVEGRFARSTRDMAGDESVTRAIDYLAAHLAAMDTPTA